MNQDEELFHDFFTYLHEFNFVIKILKDNMMHNATRDDLVSIIDALKTTQALEEKYSSLISR